jgi:homoserine O-succinyltransferase
MDGVRRRTLDEKRFGVFECARVSDRQLMTRAPSNFQIPHSRWNDLPENELTECGYRIVTRAKGAGADMVVKQRNSLLVFFQGHPEYEAQTLLLEYRRDVGRYLRRERELYMRMPEVYFDPCATEALTAFQELALSDRREELLADFRQLW